VQLSGFVGETLPQHGGLFECLAPSCRPAAVGRLGSRSHVKGPGEVLAESDVAGALSLSIVVIRQSRFKGLQRLGHSTLFHGRLCQEHAPPIRVIGLLQVGSIGEFGVGRQREQRAGSAFRLGIAPQIQGAPGIVFEGVLSEGDLDTSDQRVVFGFPQLDEAWQQTAVLPDFEATARLNEICPLSLTCVLSGPKA
jgi:hypothetical protein